MIFNKKRDRCIILSVVSFITITITEHQFLILYNGVSTAHVTFTGSAPSAGTGATTFSPAAWVVDAYSEPVEAHGDVEPLRNCSEYDSQFQQLRQASCPISKAFHKIAV